MENVSPPMRKQQNSAEFLSNSMRVCKDLETKSLEPGTLNLEPEYLKKVLRGGCGGKKTNERTNEQYCKHE